MVPEQALNVLFILLLGKQFFWSEAELEMLSEFSERTWFKGRMQRN